MIYHETEVSGAFLVDAEPYRDGRGSFARVWCAEEFSSSGLPGSFVQANVAVSRFSGTLRGLHYQVEPFDEAKLVRCVRGAIFDVVADVRPESPTYGRWCGVELTPGSDRMLYVPRGCAHGYQTLTDDTEIFYLVSAPYSPEHERGIRHDDPFFAMEWPLPVSAVSEKDSSWADHERVEAQA